MKRYIVLAIVLMTAAFAGQAWAGVAGSAHDVSIVNSTTFGVCSSCHIPHKSTGRRLWPSPITGTDPSRGDVGLLCGYCHDLSIGQLDAAKIPLVFKDYGTGSTHGLLRANAPDGTGLIDATLPYGDPNAGSLIQCTSCHNVHDQSLGGRLAFLQDDIDALCARCHPNRQFVNGTAAATQGAWGNHYGNDVTPGHAANGNPGSHPVGTDVYTDTSRHSTDSNPANFEVDSPINTSIIGIVTYGAAKAYTMGPHTVDGAAALAAGNGMGCVTCHTPHGKGQPGTTNSGTWVETFEDLLAIQQAAQSGIANGGGGTNDALCEACHRGTVAGYGGSYFPNPGAGAGTHPVDDYYNLADAGVDGTTITGLGWPIGSGTHGSGDNNILCESCHMPHPKAAMYTDNAQDDPINGGTNSHILRDADPQICNNCHTSALSNHHPVGAGLMNASAGKFYDAAIGNLDTNLDCADCHSGSGAHNWSGPGQVGLDPEWEPYNNGRTTAACSDAAQYVVNTSKECIDCHNNDGRMSPTLPHVEGEYQDRGDASHYLGAFDAAGWALSDSAVISNTFNNCGIWESRANSYSRMGGADRAGAILVCESCHDLEPAKNGGNNALLLANYQENLVENRSLLCQGCHGPTGVSGNAHPQTNDVVTRAQTANRTVGNGTLLDTTSGDALNYFADKGDVGDTWYPAANSMNCNTCHQPHDAVNASGTYVLESSGTATDVTGAPTGSVTAYRTWTNRRHGVGTLNYQNFCNLCHSSGQ